MSLPSPALVEKDWHVVQALSAIHDASADGMTLAFGGGTALGRAYRLIERMSEDIDLRIVGAEGKGRSALNRLRRDVTERLRARGFEVPGDKITVQHSGGYVRYDIPYSPIVEGTGVLRPEIKIELAAFPLHRGLVDMPVCSFVNQASNQPYEISAVRCIAVGETAADKFVALARHAGEAYAQGGTPDRVLVRHAYDLQCLKDAHDLEDTTSLALQTMQAERSRGYEAYSADPVGESLAVYERLAGDPAVAGEYGRLLSDMVFGAKPPFADAMEVISQFAERLRAVSADVLPVERP